MSSQPISPDSDIDRLREEGYAVELREGYLLVSDIPYVTSKREIRRGTLICPFAREGDTRRPNDHVGRWAGEHPCHEDGTKLTQIEHSSKRERLFADVYSDHMFSAKPKGRPVENYDDFYEKVTVYVGIISGPATVLEPGITARTHRVIDSVTDSVFEYDDTASSRTHITAVGEKLKGASVAIVGVGGTGSYVLDLIAKTPVREIHLYDKDYFLQHNAFRAPGAPAKAVLKTIPKKATYFRNLYSGMHKGIVAHEEYIAESNIDQLRDKNFVFICIDHGEAKKIIATKLHEWNIPFVDVGLGVYKSGESLGGIVRVTTSSQARHDHIEKRVSFAAGDPNADYTQAIQIADLNALNATLAVIKWKKMCGFYLDLEREHHSTYTIDGNILVNADHERCA
jgi:hypothetical protein